MSRQYCLLVHTHSLNVILSVHLAEVYTALIGLHTFTRCDIISAFSGTGKRVPYRSVIRKCHRKSTRLYAIICLFNQKQLASVRGCSMRVLWRCRANRCKQHSLSSILHKKFRFCKIFSLSPISPPTHQANQLCGICLEISSSSKYEHSPRAGHN